MKEIENHRKLGNWGGVVADPLSQHHFLLSEPVAAILIILFFLWGLRAKFTILQKYDIIYIMKERRFLRQSRHI